MDFTESIVHLILVGKQKNAFEIIQEFYILFGYNFLPLGSFSKRCTECGVQFLLLLGK